MPQREDRSRPGSSESLVQEAYDRHAEGWRSDTAEIATEEILAYQRYHDALEAVAKVAVLEARVEGLEQRLATAEGDIRRLPVHAQPVKKESSGKVTKPGFVVVPIQPKYFFWAVGGLLTLTVLSLAGYDLEKIVELVVKLIP